MSHLRRFLFCLSLCFVIVAQISAARKTREQATSQNMRIGHTTAQQALTLSAPVFQALLPGQEDLLLSAEPHEILGYAKSHHRLWTVDCVANQGADTVHLLRDADSGEILVVSCDLHREDPAPVAVAGRTAVTARARAWLSRLGYPAGWRLMGAPRHWGHAWIVVMATDQRQATIHIDAEQGNLMAVVIRAL